MDLATNTSSAAEIDGATTRTGRARFAAGIVLVVAITVLLAIALISQSRGNIGPVTRTDPLVGAAAVEFRAGERTLASTRTDPLVGAAAVEFRAGERQGAGR